MTRPSDELAQVGELPSTTLGAIDAEINNLSSTTAALGAAAQRLNGVLSDTGIEGLAGDSAAIAFEGLIAQTKKQIELIETTTAAARTAKGALSEARSADAARPALTSLRAQVRAASDGLPATSTEVYAKSTPGPGLSGPRRSALAGAAALTCVLGLGLVGPGAAVAVAAPRPAAPPVSQAADPAADGLWYVDAAGLDEAHATATGQGITVAVIDSPINPDVPELVGVDLTVHEPSFCADPASPTGYAPAVGTDEGARHGTSMASLVAGTGTGADGQPGVRGVAPGATVLYYARGLGREDEDCTAEGSSSMAAAISQALDDGAQVISLSGGGTTTTAVFDQVARAQREGAIVVVSRPNTAVVPFNALADANGAVTVESAGADGRLPPEAGTSPRKAVVAPGEEVRTLFPGEDESWNRYGTTRGTSNATAYTAGALALVWSAHPEATANQIIQTLLRHTFQNDGELTRQNDSIGYGSISVLNMLDADPTAYPDTNPLVSDDPGAQPSAAEIAGDAEEPAPTPEATDETEAPSENALPPAPPADDSGGLPGWVVPAGATLIVLVALIALAAVLTERRRRTSDATPSPTPGGHP
ncbi:S8 family serine peptidase [Actinotalea sp. BY-33]|uniref:S8 family serine peptidase n=1 Tax=Actinotalea soli TaxID=2819234 RepID=A0A939LRB7_9CELL|nr:S8 family serine peptidase [Actinotalea soli]MBO1752403.1 S8 family serine peptidase [Actinotalea soli]